MVAGASQGRIPLPLWMSVLFSCAGPGGHGVEEGPNVPGLRSMVETVRESRASG